MMATHGRLFVLEVSGAGRLFSVNPDYMPQVDRHLSELLGTEVAH